MKKLVSAIMMLLTATGISTYASAMWCPSVIKVFNCDQKNNCYWYGETETHAGIGSGGKFPGKLLSPAGGPLCLYESSDYSDFTKLKTPPATLDQLTKNQFTAQMNQVPNGMPVGYVALLPKP